jgi:hypothetical protein
MYQAVSLPELPLGQVGSLHPKGYAILLQKY